MRQVAIATIENAIKKRERNNKNAPATTASGGTFPSRHRTQATLHEQSRNGDPTT
jgi:hypothetical protein